MAGVTDLAFRARLRRNGCRALSTEMISAAAMVRRHRGTAAMAAPPDRDDDTVVQLFGANPLELGRAARMLAEVGWRRLDFNMGCPVRKVTGSGSGSALLNDLGRAEACVRELRENFDGILTVKMRAGWRAAELVFEEAGRRVEAAGADGIALHARTRAQGYGGEADWSLVERLARAVEVPVAGNGDVVDADTAVERLRTFPIRAVLVGRAAMAAPWLYAQAFALLEGRLVPPTPGPREIADDLRLQFEDMTADKGERVAVAEIKKFAAWAAKGMEGAAEYRRRVMTTKTTADVVSVIEALVSLGEARAA